jgi:Transposase
MERRRFTREFKLEAVRLIRDRGVSYAQASEDLKVSPASPPRGRPYSLLRLLGWQPLQQPRDLYRVPIASTRRRGDGALIERLGNAFQACYADRL